MTSATHSYTAALEAMAKRMRDFAFSTYDVGGPELIDWAKELETIARSIGPSGGDYLRELVKANTGCDSVTEALVEYGKMRAALSRLVKIVGATPSMPNATEFNAAYHEAREIVEPRSPATGGRE